MQPFTAATDASDFVTISENFSTETDISLDDSYEMSDFLKNFCHLSLQNLGHCLVFFIFTVIGVIGNVTLLFAILLNKQLLSVPNIFIVNLTIADLVYMLATAPFNIRHELTACWLLGTTACKIKHYVPIVAQGACVFSLAALSRERYTAIVKGFESRHKSSRRTLLIIGICWIIGLIIGIPVLVITKTNTFGLLCQYMPIDDGFTWAKGYIIFIFLILYIFPFLVISIHYAEIARTLCKNSIAQLTDTNQAAISMIRQVQARKRLALIVIIITVFFGLFWFPYHVYHMWYMFTKNHENIRGNKIQVQFFRHFYNYMSLANSCLNPWVVFLMSSAHRSPLIKCFRRLSCTEWRSKLNRRRQPKNILSATSSGSYVASTSVSKL
ncbi:bombesin receptor subtype-3-like [Amphiura filiformis]|uniref:bombesin receptor subtype-3-like n=1 Tax=Amphiura filiformis TaxID=82378 RepID=UPI003B21F630